MGKAGPKPPLVGTALRAPAFKHQQLPKRAEKTTGTFSLANARFDSPVSDWN